MVKTRKELIEHYTAVLSGYYTEFAEESRTKSGWLKTQILELDLSEDADEQQVKGIFEDFVQRNDDFTLKQLGEELFYCLRPSSADETNCIYIDALDLRFPILYSIMHSDSFNETIEELTKLESVDKAWFPQDFMSSLDTLGLFKGYGGRFNNGFFTAKPGESLDDNPDYRSLSFKSWGHTKRLLDLIKSDSELRNEFALTNMRIKVAHDPKNDSDTSIDDVTYSGRVTSLGRSFMAHYDAISRIKDSYRNIVVNVIEAKYAVNYEDYSLKGARLVFAFGKQIDNLHEFSSKLFSGRKPFRLWGLETVKKDNFLRLEVVDLHVKDRFMVEIHPSYLSVLITQGVCGNTVMRLLTLLQQNLNAGVSLVDAQGEVIELSVDNG